MVFTRTPPTVTCLRVLLTGCAPRFRPRPIRLHPVNTTLAAASLRNSLRFFMMPSTPPGLLLYGREFWTSLLAQLPHQPRLRQPPVAHHALPGNLQHLG